MTTWIILAGAMAGAGTAMLIAYLLPAQPDLGSALSRLDPDRSTADNRPVAPLAGDGTAAERIGRWLVRKGALDRVRTPDADLDVIGWTKARYLGQKMALAAVGLFFPTVFTAWMGLLGISLPLAIPFIAGPAMAAVGWFITDAEVKRRAAAAREGFTRAVASYVDLVALEKQGGAGTSQALEAASSVGDSWVFTRIREELGRARWAGEPPWDALTRLGDQLQIAALTDLGDIMRMSGEEGVAVVGSLRARAASSRDAVLAADHAKANQANEKLAMPVAALGIVFLALLAAPAILRIAAGS